MTFIRIKVDLYKTNFKYPIFGCSGCMGALRRKVMRPTKGCAIDIASNCGKRKSCKQLAPQKQKMKIGQKDFSTKIEKKN